MKLAILTCTTSNRKWLYDITNPSKEKYAKLFGYDFIFDTEFYPDKEYKPGWNKIQFILKYINNYDYVMWIDDDAGFIKFDNIEEKLKDFIKSNKSLFICKDLNGINSGVMIFKNNEFTKFMLNTIWKNRHLYKTNNHGHPGVMEQPAIIDMCNLYYNDVFIGDGKIFNAYDKICLNSPINNRINESIILHIANGGGWKELHKELIKKLYT